MAAAVSTLYETAPRPWRLEGDTVVIGARRVALADVVSAEAVGFEERDIDGPLLGFSSYALLACLFVIDVVVLGARTRFLVASVLLGAIGIMCLQDVLTARPIRYFRVRIALRSGGTCDFASPHRHEIDALLAVLRTATER